MRSAAALACLALLLAPSCLRVGYRRELAYEPPTVEALAVLRLDPAGAGMGFADDQQPVDFATALEQLGAPLYAWPLGDEGLEGAALVWAWSNRRRWNLNLSVPLNNNTSGSFEFESGQADLDALVLFFRTDWTLREWQFGQLADLLRGAEDTFF